MAKGKRHQAGNVLIEQVHATEVHITHDLVVLEVAAAPRVVATGRYDRSVVVKARDRDGVKGSERAVVLPETISPRNVESVGFNLLAEHPGSIEIAGVILLMAMLGAVVLSRKQVELDEELKKQQSQRLASGASDGLGGAA